MKVAAVQHDIVWEDSDANLAALEPRIAAAAAAGARLVVLTEMFATGFSMNTAVTAQPPDGPVPAFLQRVAREHDVHVAGSFAELPPDGRAAGRGAGGAARDADGSPPHGRPDDRPTNTLLLASPDGSSHRYRKIHPFTHTGEDRHFAAGVERVTVRVDDLRVALFVCYDLRFADEFWPLAPTTDCYLVVANWPAERRAHWRTLLRARAIENQAYVVGVNRVGDAPGLHYAGDSAIIDPDGRVLASASEAETLVLADVDAEVVADTRDRLRFLQDRR